MVVLTLVTKKNGETIYFENSIPKVHFMNLISCSLFNSWDTLKEGSANVELQENVKSVSKLPPGHYDLQTLAKEIGGLIGKYEYSLRTETNTPVGQLVIKNNGLKPIELDNDLANLLGIKQKLPIITFVKRLTSPTTYFIHCDLIDKSQNLFNGKRSDLLAMIDVKGKSYEKVTYHASPQHILHFTFHILLISSITISVKNENSEHFDFKDMPMEFELELS